MVLYQVVDVTTLANGTYDVEVTDANGCSTIGNVEVTGILNAIPEPVVSSSGPGNAIGTKLYWLKCNV